VTEKEFIAFLEEILRLIKEASKTKMA